MIEQITAVCKQRYQNAPWTRELLFCNKGTIMPVSLRSTVIPFKSTDAYDESAELIRSLRAATIIGRTSTARSGSIGEDQASKHSSILHYTQNALEESSSSIESKLSSPTMDLPSKAGAAVSGLLRR